MIEDSKSGIAAARAAGMPAVALKARGTDQDLSAADKIVGSLGGINIKTLHGLLS